MPRKSDYSLEIVEATTGEPFKEHPGKGNIDAHVEVEPDAECYIDITNHSKITIEAKIRLDGKLLERSLLEPGEGYYRIGSSYTYDKKNQKHVVKPFKVDKPRSQSSYERKDRSNEKTSIEEENAIEVGTVEVKFYEWVDLGETESKSAFSYDHNPSRSTKNINDGKKIVLSQQGNAETVLEEDESKMCKGERGKKLETVRVKYCTAVGLIIEGVLSKPPLWDYYKMANPRAVLDSRINPAIEPTLVKNETRDADGNIMSSKCYEMFDLTDEGSKSDYDAETTMNDNDSLSENQTNMLKSEHEDEGNDESNKAESRSKRKLLEDENDTIIEKIPMLFEKVEKEHQDFIHKH